MKFKSNIESQAGIEDSAGSAGTDGKILSSLGVDGNGVAGVEWIDQGDVAAGEADKAKSVILRVKNSTLSAMTKGQVICENVSISPPSGNLIEVALADNNAAGRMPALGILNEDLDAAGGSNDEGDAIMFGKVSGIDTSAFQVGDEVFVSDAPGGLTTTKPTGVKYIQKVGVVIRDDNTNGTIEVFGAGRVNDVPTPLYIDHANQRLGIGTTSPQAKLHVSNGALRTWTPTSGTSAIFESTVSNRNFVTLTAANEAELWFGDATTQAKGRIRYEIRNSLVNLERMEFWTNATEKMVIDGSGNVGIGAENPGEKLHVSGSGGVRLQVESTDSYEAALNLTNTAGSYGSFVNSSGSLSTYDYNAASTRTTLISNGHFGIGTTSPGQKLEVNGNIKLSETAAATGTDKFVVLDSGVLKYRTGAQVISDLPTDSRYVAVVGDTMTGALTVNAKFTANDVDKHAPSVVYDADAGQVLKNEDSELAIGLGSVYPTSVNYPLWVQGRKNDDTARNICLQPVGGSVQIGVDNFNADKGSLATGYENEINGKFSFATGKTNVLGTSEATAAIGRLNEVTGLGSTAIGIGNTVTSKNTVVIGSGNTANNEDNFILGLANTTQKIQSIAVGRANNLNSAKIVSVGHYNTSSGTTDNATSFGYLNESLHSNSHLFGINLQSSQEKEVIIGKNNDTPSNPTGPNSSTAGANVIIGVGTGQYAGANMNAVEYYGFNDGSMQVIHKALLNASSYANDTAAAAGGVPIGGLYRYNNNVKIRLT